MTICPRHDSGSAKADSLLNSTLDIKTIDWIEATRNLGVGAVGETCILIVVSGQWLVDSADQDQRRDVVPGDVILFRNIEVQVSPQLSHEMISGVTSKMLCVRGLCKFDPAIEAIPRLEVAQGACPPLHRSAETRQPELLIASLLMGLIARTLPRDLTEGSHLSLDAEITIAVEAIEKDPAAAWTVQKLAMTAGISRSALAQKFKEQTGQTPNDYLLNVRMKLAEKMLVSRQHHLKEIARRTGYQSVSAFSTAFKRWSGASPSQRRRQTFPVPQLSSFKR